MQISDFSRYQPIENLIYWFYQISNPSVKPRENSERKIRLPFASDLAASLLGAGVVYLSIDALIFGVYLIQNSLGRAGAHPGQAAGLTKEYLLDAIYEVMGAGRGADLEVVLPIFGVFATLLVAVAFMDLQDNSKTDNFKEFLTTSREARVGAAIFNALDILALALSVLCINLVARNFYNYGLYDWVSLFSFNSICSVMIAATVCVLMVGVKEGDLGVSSRVRSLSRKVENLTEEEVSVTGLISSFPARGRGYFSPVLSGVLTVLLIAYFSAVDWALLFWWVAMLLLWIIWLAFFEASFPSWRVTGSFIGGLLKILSTASAYAISLYLSLLTISHHEWWKNGLFAKLNGAGSEFIVLGALGILCVTVWVVIYWTSEWVHYSSLRAFEFLNAAQEEIRRGLLDAEQQINKSREYLRKG